MDSMLVIIVLASESIKLPRAYCYCADVLCLELEKSTQWCNYLYSKRYDVFIINLHANDNV